LSQIVLFLLSFLLYSDHTVELEEDHTLAKRFCFVHVRFAYCALSSLTILDALDRVNVDACVDWILPHP
jgi:prenyltransferase beta subunit